MGVRVWNLNAVKDYATGGNAAAVELHMQLPLAADRFDLVSKLLEANDWDGAREELCEVYPQHAELLANWIEGCKQRKASEQQVKVKRAALV